MRKSFRSVTIYPLGLAAALTLGACSGMIRSVTDPIGASLGNTLSTGLACGLNGALAGAEERLTVQISSAAFEGMRARLRTLPERPNVDQHRGVLTPAEESVLGDALLNVKYDVGSTKVGRLLTLPQTEELLLRALVHIAKSPSTSTEWTFKRIALANDPNVKKLDPEQTVVRLSVRLTGNGGTLESKIQTVVFCD